ncbi:alpha/beta hydrolase [Castellaniella sp.]|uniref:alpha/beta fold hydrolase n=1 Tax=Castellaniella sp. TaxID=1955812 RepID=UPI002AFFAC41|nr:alpha/beta hydrolase [Castellaniella sp.]
MNMNRAIINDIDVAYTVEGAGDPVVFIHGLAEDLHTWRAQQRALGGRYRSFACDLRGHGMTTLGQCDGTLAQLGNDLLAFIGQVSGPATVVGFSLGGAIALWAAAERPDLVRKSVVLGTSSVVGHLAVQFYEERIAQAADTGSAAFREAMRADTEAGLFRARESLDRIVAARLAAVGDGRGYVNAARAMMGLRAEPLTPRLSRIETPVVVIGAEHDRFCPQKAATILLEALPGAEFMAIPDAGHLMNVDNPDAVTRALRQALAD